MINHRLKSLYTHIPKCGGNSIVQILKKYPPYERIGHKQLRRVIKKYGGSDYYKFTFTRNPWDRLVSAYHYLRAGGMKNPSDKRSAKILQQYDGFDDFVKKYDINETKICHFLPMTYYTGRRTDDYDYIGKVENLQQDFDFVCDKIGIPQQQLPHVNKTKHKHYTEYYDDETKSIVAKKYAKDIEYFGYEFGK